MYEFLIFLGYMLLVWIAIIYFLMIADKIRKAEILRLILSKTPEKIEIVSAI